MNVYVINCDAAEIDFREHEHKGEFQVIMDEATRQGGVYTLEEFQDAINDEELGLENSFILIR